MEKIKSKLSLAAIVEMHQTWVRVDEETISSLCLSVDNSEGIALVGLNASIPIQAPDQKKGGDAVKNLFFSSQFFPLSFVRKNICLKSFSLLLTGLIKF